MILKEKDYSGSVEWIASAHAITRTATGETAQGVTVDGKKVIKSGQVWPSNDGEAKGLVMYEVDVTDGAQPIAILVEGYVYEDRLPAAVDDLAKPALAEIKYVKYNETEV